MDSEPRGPGRPPISERAEARIERELRKGAAPKEVIGRFEGATHHKVYEVYRRLKREARTA